MKSLPDPRTYASFSAHPLVLLAERAAKQCSALQHNAAGKSLLDALVDVLAKGDDEWIQTALRDATSAATHATLARAMEIALEPSAETPVTVRLFAVPLLIVTGGKDSGIIPGVVPDTDELQKLFEDHGALGQAKNFGFGNALASAESVARVSPGFLYRMSQGREDLDFKPPDLAPQDIELQSVEERAHLRFLPGVAVTPRHAPDFTETAGNIGAWGLPFTRALAAQLGQEGLSLLPIPRPPMSLHRVLEAGCFAFREIGLQLFLSGALRKFRGRIGEPETTVVAYADGSLRVRLDSPLADSLAEEYCWPLHPGDDFAAVSESIFGLLTECRLENVQVTETVQPAPASH